MTMTRVVAWAMVCALMAAVGWQGVCATTLRGVLRLQPPNSEWLEDREPVGSAAPGTLRLYFGYELPEGARGLVSAKAVGSAIEVEGCSQGLGLVWRPLGKVTQGALQGFGFFVSQGCHPNSDSVRAVLREHALRLGEDVLVGPASVRWEGPPGTS